MSDRAEQMRARLAAKAEKRSAFSGVLISAIPAPNSPVLAGKSIAWCFWLIVAMLLPFSLWADGKALLGFSALHLAYFLNFSQTSIAIQVRVLFLVGAILGQFVVVSRVVVYGGLLVNVAAIVFADYSMFERFLYLLAFNRPENDEDFTFDFLKRVFTEPPNPNQQKFSVRPPDSGGFEYAKSRNERRKGK
eukprot:gnl/MRDRNA2_/MRDRNA2_27450_c0_seq1.p1 gnl/MRDRNA2_/MRDRNA2_27450_c0~~gnl/MRDRNA2_/MRDRNA2_27450_c0_seq1.p1  ORF type:complete len:191 (-),score=24.43 gnl/MRDRNA2_/MRDRNA2_27450_c0_seq1:38-610(-)